MIGCHNDESLRSTDRGSRSYGDTGRFAQVYGSQSGGCVDGAPGVGSVGAGTSGSGNLALEGPNVPRFQRGESHR